MNGLEFFLGGRLDPSYRNTLTTAVAEAKAAGLEMQAALRVKITGMEKKYATQYGKPLETLNQRISVTSASDPALAAMILQRNKLEEGSVAFLANIEQQKLKLRLMTSTQATALARNEAVQVNASEASKELSVAQTAAQKKLAEQESAMAAVAARESEVAAQSKAEAEKIALLLEEKQLMKAAEAEKVAFNQKAMTSIVSQEAEKAQAEAALQDIELANRAKTEAEKVAMVKASQLAMIATAARNIPGEHGIAGSGPGGGISGILRESQVIVRELLRHNYSRVAGSASLLAQYSGLMGKVIKSSAAESLQAAAAENKLAVSMSQAAEAAEAKAVAAANAAGISQLSTEIDLANTEANDAVTIAQAKRAAATELASTADAESSAVAIANSEALTAEATAARLTAIAQIKRAEAANAAKAASLASATVGIGALGYLLIVLLLVGAAAYFVWRHIKNLNKELDEQGKEAAKGYGDYTKALAETMDEASKETADFNDWLQKLGMTYDDLKKKTDLEIESLREQYNLQKQIAQDAGLSAPHLKAAEAGMEVEQAQKELKVLQAAQEVAKNKKDEAQVAAIAAQKEVGFDPTKEKRLGELAAIPGGARTAAQKTEMEALLRERSQNPAIQREARERNLTSTINDAEKRQALLKESVMPDLQKQFDAAVQTRAGQMTSHPDLGESEKQYQERFKRNVDLAEKNLATEPFMVGEKGKQRQYTYGGVQTELDQLGKSLDENNSESFAFQKQILVNVNEANKRKLSDAEQNATKTVEDFNTRADAIAEAISKLNLAKVNKAIADRQAVIATQEADFQSSLELMTRPEQESALRKRIKMFQDNAKLYSAIGESSADISAQGQLDQADKLKKQLDRDLREDKGKSGNRLDMTEWTAIGGSLGGPQMAILDATKAQHQDIKAIRHVVENFNRISPERRTSPWGGFRR